MLVATTLLLVSLRRRIDQQTQIVAQIRATGRYSTIAEQLLAQFKISYQNYLTDRDLILGFLRSLDRKSRFP